MMDLTGIGIGAGVVGTVVFAVVHVRMRGRMPSLARCAVLLLSVFACVIGPALVLAGMLGDPSRLPSAWREYMGLAGVACVYIAITEGVVPACNVLRGREPKAGGTDPDVDDQA